MVFVLTFVSICQNASSVVTVTIVLIVVTVIIVLAVVIAPVLVIVVIFVVTVFVLVVVKLFNFRKQYSRLPKKILKTKIRG